MPLQSVAFFFQIGISSALLDFYSISYIILRLLYQNIVFKYAANNHKS
ncbi:hypothetical protein NIES2107_18820 [Nostoc carneum NIES-2107]|nr:hypothetical protein NIES2107_18820 [Nostoc carneum NIES-2107]